MDMAGSAGKRRVAKFWNDEPCGSRLAGDAAPGSAAFFDRTEAARDRREPFIARFARFDQWKDKRVLEVGCGTGVDLSKFARRGARAFAIDLTPTGASLARARALYLGCSASTTVGDAENLPFHDSTFDLVYSWGVIHHTPDTARAASEIVRVLRPGGDLIVMIYHRRSIVALQAWLRYGLLRGSPFRPIAEIVASHLESPGTKAFTIAEARALFSGCRDLNVSPVLTPYDLRISREHFLPSAFARALPQRAGYFLVVTGRKQAIQPMHVGGSE